MTNDELDRLQGLCDGATPGPWGLDGPGGDEYDKVTAETPDFIDVAYDVLHDGDAAFIAAARTALPALISEVRRLQAFEAAILSNTPRLCSTCANRHGSLSEPPCAPCRNQSAWQFDVNHHTTHPTNEPNA